MKTKVLFMAMMVLGSWSYSQARPLESDSFPEPSDDIQIIGGSKVSAKDAISSTTVALLTGDALCTASLIEEDIALTAAHCVDGVSADDMKLVFGSNIAAPVHVAEVVAAKAHEQYDGASPSLKDRHDIALVKFSGGIPAGFKKAALLADDSRLVNGGSVTLAGYGITNARTHAGVGVLRKTAVVIEEAEFGNTEIRFDQTAGKGACHGDSGGPAFVKVGAQSLLFGITSRGGPDDTGDDCAHDSVYTKVTAYLSWIKKGL